MSNTRSDGSHSLFMNISAVFEDDRRPDDPGRADIGEPREHVDAETVQTVDALEASLAETVVVRRE